MVREGDSRRRSRASGFTLVEVMVVIAIVAIATAVAIPDLTSWVVNSRIRDAAGHIEEDMQWARAYALKSDQPVYVQIEYMAGANGGTVCAWSASLQPGLQPTTAPVLLNSPNMTASQFSTRYANVSCALVPVMSGSYPSTSPAAGTPLNLEFSPNGTIIVPSTNDNSYNLTFGGVLVEARSDTAKYSQWLVRYYGAGELRSCFGVLTAGTGSWSCVLH
ncbi:MAG: pilus assembly FimT family protein [Acidiferrobacter sp.]